MHRSASAALTLLGAIVGALTLTAAGEAARAEPPASDPLECLALNVYWEARAGAEEDQLAVAWVTLNRVAHPGFPDTICEVVYHGGEDELNKCQFSWWCDGKPDTPANPKAWEHARTVARQAIAAAVPDPTDGALYFHHDSIRPDWAGEKTFTASIGPHHFYK